MALLPFGGTATIPAGAPVSVLTLLAQNSANAAFLARDVRPTFGSLSIRAASGNAGSIYFGDSNLTNPVGSTAFGFIGAGEAVGWSLNQLRMFVDTLYIAGTTGDTLYINAVQY
jgi:hypothetical protein